MIVALTAAIAKAELSLKALPPAQLVYAGTVYTGPKGNFVFNASTCWWADGLSEPPGYVRPSVYTSPKGTDPRAQRITCNLLERMRGSEPRA
jgi:hypothetical protein